MYIHKIRMIYGIATLFRRSILGNCSRLRWLITFIIQIRGFCYRVLISKIETGNKDSSAAGHNDSAVVALVFSRNEHAVFRINLISAVVRLVFNHYLENEQVTWASAFTDFVNLKESLFRIQIAEVDSLKTIEHDSFRTSHIDCDFRCFPTIYIGRCVRNLLRVAWLIALRQSILASHRKFHACLLTAFQRNNTVTCT